MKHLRVVVPSGEPMDEKADVTIVNPDGQMAVWPITGPANAVKAVAVVETKMQHPTRGAAGGTQQSS